MEKHSPNLHPNTYEDITNPFRISYASITWAYIGSSVLLVIFAINDLLSFRNIQTWHVLADAVALIISLLLLQLSFRQYREGNFRLAEALVPLVIIFAYVPGEFIFSDVTLMNLLSGVLLLVFLGLVMQPRNSNLWIGLSFLYVALILLGSQYSPFTKFGIYEAVPSWLSGSIISTALFLVGVVWQTMRLLQQATIRSRLMVAFIILGFIPVAIVALISSSIGYQFGVNQVTRHLSTVIEFKLEELNTFLNTQSQILDNTLKRDNLTYDFYRLISAPLSPLSIETAYNTIQDRLQFTVETSEFIELMVIDFNGIIQVATDPALEGLNVSGDDYFVNGSKSLYTQPVQISSIGNKIILIQALPLYSETGVNIGVIAGQIDFRAINDILKVSEGMLGETGEIYLVNDDKVLLTPVNFSEFVPGLNSIDTHGVNTILDRKTSGIGTYTNYNDQDVIGTFEYLPGLGIAIVGEEVQSEAFQAVQLNLLANVMIMIATITISIGVAFVISRGIARPIATLARKAAIVAQGDLEQDFTVEQRDEVGDLSQALNQMTAQIKSSMQNLEEIVAERTSALESRARSFEAAAEIGRAATQIYNLDNLLSSVTHLISERFGFYHVGIFMIDENKEFAVLKAANSEGGWRMLNRGHRLKIGEQGIVGFVTGNRMPRVQQKVGDDDVYYDNPDLPMTRSEMALPMIVGGELLGALDVQSTEESAFTDEDLEFLQVLADEVAMAINNTQLFEQLEQRLEAERRFYGELSSQAWQNLLDSGSQFGYRSDPRGVQPADQQLSLEAQQAIQEKRTVWPPFSPNGINFPLAVPIKTHGDTVVAVLDTYKHVDSGPWTSEEVEVLESISEQIGIAMENARLFEETQRLARKERIAADVSGKVWASPNVDTILQTAVQELSKALNVTQGTIRLSLSEDNGQENEPQTQEFGAQQE